MIRLHDLDNQEMYIEDMYIICITGRMVNMLDGINSIIYTAIPNGSAGYLSFCAREFPSEVYQIIERNSKHINVE